MAANGHCAVALLGTNPLRWTPTIRRSQSIKKTIAYDTLNNLSAHSEWTFTFASAEYDKMLESTRVIFRIKKDNFCILEQWTA